MTTRAERRHHRERLKKKRQYHWGYGHKDEWMGRTPPEAGDINYMSAKISGMVSRTPTTCSCGMCGNPRNKGWDNPNTMQERKANEDYEDQIMSTETM